MAQRTVDLNLENLNNLEDNAQRIDDLLGEFGAYMESQTKENFLREETPEGKPWPELAPSTLEQKTSGSILRETSSLFNSITFEKRQNRVLVGPIGGPEYAIHHQFGTAKMPQREYLGVLDSDVEAMKQMARRYLFG